MDLDATGHTTGTDQTFQYALLTDATCPALVGTVSYKGRPADGVVEIGYSVVRSRQRCGLATEACRALIESAWERQCWRVRGVRCRRSPRLGSSSLRLCGETARV